jgi:hypothetical protein
MHQKFRQEKPYILLNGGYLSDLWEISCYTDQGIIFAASGNRFRCIRQLPFSLICRLVPRYEAPASRWRRSPMSYDNCESGKFGPTKSDPYHKEKAFC